METLKTGFVMMWLICQSLKTHVMPTWSLDSFAPHTYIAKQGFSGVCFILLIFALNIEEQVPTIFCLSKNRKNITFFIPPAFMPTGI